MNNEKHDVHTNTNIQRPKRSRSPIVTINLSSAVRQEKGGNRRREREAAREKERERERASVVNPTKHRRQMRERERQRERHHVAELEALDRELRIELQSITNLREEPVGSVEAEVERGVSLRQSMAQEREREVVEQAPSPKATRVAVTLPSATVPTPVPLAASASAPGVVSTNVARQLRRETGSPQVSTYELPTSNAERRRKGTQLAHHQEPEADTVSTFHTSLAVLQSPDLERPVSSMYNTQRDLLEPGQATPIVAIDLSTVSLTGAVPEGEEMAEGQCFDLAESSSGHDMVETETETEMEYGTPTHGPGSDVDTVSVAALMGDSLQVPGGTSSDVRMRDSAGMPVPVSILQASQDMQQRMREEEERQGREESEEEPVDTYTMRVVGTPTVSQADGQEGMWGEREEEGERGCESSMTVSPSPSPTATETEAEAEGVYTHSPLARSDLGTSAGSSDLLASIHSILTPHPSTHHPKPMSRHGSQAAVVSLHAAESNACIDWPDETDPEAQESLARTQVAEAEVDMLLQSVLGGCDEREREREREAELTA
ncbi:hypothetical protein KIPB_003877 [Kipferlia bialata]|uniref:Uncharacterized protein n=1 Tax=Kipferlia bialata TaxID=797122 RepID=A0A391NT79_9EUKA|nr:hypothetical protein KIPB_003877 [Kipferlia bialata]|eukprot:g3877.t1